MGILLGGLLLILAACAKSVTPTPATTPTTPVTTALVEMPPFHEMGPPESLDPWPGVYEPTILTVLIGTNVTWRNRDNKEHTLISDDGLFNKHLAYGESFSYTFTARGIFNYHCELWDMKGRVIVE